MEAKGSLSINEVLQRVGEFGMFQKMLDAMFFTLNIPVAYQILITYFTTLTPTWRCVSNSSLCTYNKTLPGGDERRCQLPRSEWYYTEPKEYTLVTQFQLDCGKSWMLHLISSVYFIGWGSGGVVLGWLGDKFGRKAVLFPSVLATLILGFVTSFLQNVYGIVACRFLIGFCNPGSTLQSFILISEYVGSEQRPFAGIIVYLCLPVGYIIVAMKAYLTKNWRILSLVCTAPYIFVLAFYKFVPESVKWLQLHGKTDELSATVQRIAYWNKREISPDLQISPSPDLSPADDASHTVSKSRTFDLFRTRELTLHTLLVGIVWLVTGIAYFGLSLAADDLGGSAYRDFIILSVFELPALALAIDFCTRFGRKPSTLVPLFIGGLASILLVFIPSHGKVKVLRVLFGIFGKFCLAIAFDAVYTWSVELYPTNVRSEGMGFLQAISHIGSASAPWIAQGLRPIARWLPFVVLGVPALLGAVCGMWLPETKQTEEKSCGGDVKSRGYENYGAANIEVEEKV